MKTRLPIHLKSCGCVLATLLWAAGCASTKPVGFEAAQSFQPGTTTMQDAQKLFGRPQSMSRQQGGDIILGWLRLPAGTVGPNTHGLAVQFGPDGRFIKVIQTYQGHMGY